MKIKLIRGSIQEMDMKSAGLSVLTERGCISEELYLDLCDGDKLDRNIALGKAMIDMKINEKDVSRIIDEDVRSYVNQFIEANKLQPSNILEIAKDAIFIYNANPRITTFGDHIVFRCKERYFLMIEFPISESNKNPIKIYKKYAGLAIRGAKLDLNHPAYYVFMELIDHILNRSTKMYFKTLKRFIDVIRGSEDHLINSVENEHLINVFKEITM